MAPGSTTTGPGTIIRSGGGSSAVIPWALVGGMNTYAYVGGDPVNGSDPSGLFKVYAYPNRGGGDGWKTQYVITFQPLVRSIVMRIEMELSKGVSRLADIAENIDVTPVGPLHPDRDYIACHTLDSALQREYTKRFGSPYQDTQLTRDQALSFLQDMASKYPKMSRFYAAPGTMLNQATANMQPNWFNILGRGR